MPHFNDPRIFLTPFAANGTRNNITEEQLNFGAASLSLGFPPETQQPEEAGGIPPDRADFNGAFHLLSSHTAYQALGGRYKFSPVIAEAKDNPGYPKGAVLAHDNPAIPYLLRSLKDNNTDNFNTNPEVIGVSWAIEAQGVSLWNEHTVYRAPCLAFAPNGGLYMCLQDNGPGTQGGVKNPATSPTFWHNPTAQHYIGEWKNWHEQVAPPGWAVRNGKVLSNVDVDYPELWAFVTNPANNWKVKTMAEWQEQSNKFGGVGGVTFFGLDVSARQVRLLDTRGQFEGDAGADGNSVGSAHRDCIQNITGSFDQFRGSHAEGAFTLGEYVRRDVIAGGSTVFKQHRTYFNAANVARTSDKTLPPSAYTLPCIYIGGI